MIGCVECSLHCPAAVFAPQAELASKEAEYTHLAQEVHQYSAHHSIQELETLRTQVGPGGSSSSIVTAVSLQCYLSGSAVLQQCCRQAGLTPSH